MSFRIGRISRKQNYQTIINYLFFQMKMKTSFFLSAVMAAGLLASCSNSEEVFNEQVTDGEHSGAQLNIVPTVSSESTETRAGFDPKTDWAAGDAMGLFMYKSSGWGDAYPRYDAQNNKSTRQANSWSQASPVYLLAEKATIWTYYPFVVKYCFCICKCCFIYLPTIHCVIIFFVVCNALIVVFLQSTLVYWIFRIYRFFSAFKLCN